MDVTVFGGTGFLGGAVVAQLLELGAVVRVAARHPNRLKTAATRERLQLHVADVRSADSVQRAVAGAEAVVNVVGLYTERADDTFDSVHVAGARVVAEQSATAGVKCLVHVSGIGANADSASKYVRARAAGERAAMAAFDGTVVVRPSVLFGPGDAFLNTIDSITRVAPVFPLFGDGGTRLQPVFVGDVADGIARLVQGLGTGKRVFEFGGPDTLTYRSVVRNVLRYRHRRRWLIRVPFAVWSAQAQLLGFLPNPPLTEDQVILMRDDNVVGEGVATLPSLGVVLNHLEPMLPVCLDPKPPR